MQANNLAPGTKKIYLSGKKGAGKFALVDEKDYLGLSKSRWFLKSGYAVRIIHIKKQNGDKTTKTIYMHRLVTNAPDSKEVDHKNHNRLDNRSSNLRVCSHSENQLNNRAKGYCWDNTTSRWRVTVKEDGKYRYRFYKVEKDAIVAAKMVRSGNIPPKKNGYRSKYMPQYISRNTPSGYLFRCVINGVTYRKFGFKNVSEAVAYRDAFFSKHNINISRKEIV